MKCSIWRLNLHFEKEWILSILHPTLSPTRTQTIFDPYFLSYTHVLTILCVYKCVTWYFFGYCSPHYLILFCCRASTNCVVFWNCTLYLPTTWLLCALWQLKKWPRPLTNGAPLTRAGHCTRSHENKSVCAEIRGLLKIHLNSSQAPLVADSSTSGGHSRHSYWLILSALAHFKWVTKSEAGRDAGCTVSVLSVTIFPASKSHKPPRWPHWGLG